MLKLNRKTLLAVECPDSKHLVAFANVVDAEGPKCIQSQTKILSAWGEVFGRSLPVLYSTCRIDAKYTIFQHILFQISNKSKLMVLQFDRSQRTDTPTEYT
ncbi:hypothetical protein AG1IA_07128 [Rhizoctonia solani AG-1 IA]|uniref:Uncharacterized protein n=1 Tax=Thanatephorus cucumeris (strain AG1-IA) TaxID=983506 RepID=L8WQ05_THACA|nr:hypothetical protein AG1IA_07128 [Rhizoctonia solani AG-1 IA]